MSSYCAYTVPETTWGEIALLTDAVRTASAATLEDTALLVLSRRAFVECLSDYPQIALNLDTSLE